MHIFVGGVFLFYLFFCIKERSVVSACHHRKANLTFKEAKHGKLVQIWQKTKDKLYHELESKQTAAIACWLQDTDVTNSDTWEKQFAKNERKTKHE